jgi:magnesium transporter
MSYAIHNNNLAFNESAVAQYMNTDFIVLDISLCVALAREQFFEKLKDDDIPSHIFIEDNGRLAGMIAVRKLLHRRYGAAGSGADDSGVYSAETGR